MTLKNILMPTFETYQLVKYEVVISTEHVDLV